MLQIFWNGYKAFKKWRQNIGLHIWEEICWPFRAWFWCHIFVLFFLRPIFCDRDLCHGKNWKSFWKYMPGEMCTYFCLNHSSIRGLFKGLYISPSLRYLLLFTVFSKGLFFSVWGLLCHIMIFLTIHNLKPSHLSYEIIPDWKSLVHLGKLYLAVNFSLLSSMFPNSLPPQRPSSLKLSSGHQKSEAKLPSW